MDPFAMAVLLGFIFLTPLMHLSREFSDVVEFEDGMQPRRQMPFKEPTRKIISLKRRRKMRMSKSSNLLVEDLHIPKQLETVYYATELEQMTDFVWFRNSGIRVNVALYNINVVPVYSDVQHQHSDNDFVTQHLDYIRTTFQEATEGFCRHPVPDFYNLTLEIFRDRETKAWIETEIDEGGQKHWTLKRKVNEACHQRAPQVVLQSGSNVFLCTEENPLLNQIFEINPSPQVISTTSSSFKNCVDDWNRCAACGQNALQCFQALNQAELDATCCMISCLSRYSCRNRYNLECHLESKIDCAKGDAYRYSLLPIFEHPSREIHCHLKRKPLRILYSLSYHLSLPSSIETFPVKHQITMSPFRQPKTLHKLDFLNIEFHSNSPPNEEMMLTIRRTSTNKLEYLARPIIQPSSSLQSPHVYSHEVLRDTYLTSVQFHPPFACSTSSWNASCQSNMSGVGKLPGSSMNVIKSRRAGSSFEYLISEPDKSPHLRLYLPGNSSILRSWFQNMNHELLWFETNVSIVDLRHLIVGIKGEVSQCPSYLMLIGSDLIAHEELFRLDLLITCPTTFDLVICNVTLALSQNKNEKVLELTVDDLTREQTVFQTIVSKSQELKNNATTNSTESLNDIPRGNFLQNFGVIFVILIAVFIFLVCCFSLALLNEFPEGRTLAFREQCLFRRNTYDVPSLRLCQPSKGNLCTSLWAEEKMKRIKPPFVECYKLFFACFIVSKIIYNILFTFTVITLLLFAWINESIDGERDVECLRVWKSKEFWRIFEKFGDCLEYNDAFEEKQESCEAYIGVVINFLKKELRQLYVLKNEKKNIADISSTIKNISDKKVGWQTKAFEHFVKIMNNSTGRIMNNYWFLYPNFMQKKVAELNLREDSFSSIDVKCYLERLKMIFKQIESEVRKLSKLPAFESLLNHPRSTGLTSSTVVNLNKYFVSDEYLQPYKSSLEKVTQLQDKFSLCDGSNGDDDDRLIQLQSILIILFVFSDTLLLLQRFTNLIMFSMESRKFINEKYNLNCRYGLDKAFTLKTSSFEVWNDEAHGTRSCLKPIKHCQSLDISSSSFSLECNYLSSNHLKPANESFPSHLKVPKKQVFRRRTTSQKFVTRGFWSFFIMAVIVLVKGFITTLTTLLRDATPRLDKLVSSLTPDNLCFLQNTMASPSFSFDLQQLQALCQFSTRELKWSFNHIKQQNDCKLQILSCIDHEDQHTSLVSENEFVPQDLHANNLDEISDSLTSTLDVIMCVIIFFVLSTTLATVAHLTFIHFARVLQQSSSYPLSTNEFPQDTLSETLLDRDSDSKPPSPDSCVGNRERMLEKRHFTTRITKHCKFSETKV